MTVIAWDGKTLAADKLTTSGDVALTTTKIFTFELDNKPVYAASCGTLVEGLILIDWYKDGADPEKYPEFQKGEKTGSTLVIVRDGVCYEWQTYATPIKHQDPFIAFGCGREFAIGAMAAGATAIEAVEIASRHNPDCGRGVDAFDTVRETQSSQEN